MEISKLHVEAEGDAHEVRIAAFSGDPANVTVFGASHGSRSAAALMVSPRAQGLSAGCCTKLGPPRASASRGGAKAACSRRG